MSTTLKEANKIINDPSLAEEVIYHFIETIIINYNKINKYIFIKIN